jgi:hypothetical protein
MCNAMWINVPGSMYKKGSGIIRSIGTSESYGPLNSKSPVFGVATAMAGVKDAHAITAMRRLMVINPGTVLVDRVGLLCSFMSYSPAFLDQDLVSDRRKRILNAHTQPVTEWLAKRAIHTARG